MFRKNARSFRKSVITICKSARTIANVPVAFIKEHVPFVKVYAFFVKKCMYVFGVLKLRALYTDLDSKAHNINEALIANKCVDIAIGDLCIARESNIYIYIYIYIYHAR